MRLDIGSLSKEWSDTADALTFISIPFRYPLYKKVCEFMRSLYKCIKHEWSWRRWRKGVKDDRYLIKRYLARLRAIDLLIKLHEQKTPSTYGGGLEMGNLWHDDHFQEGC